MFIPLISAVILSNTPVDCGYCTYVLCSSSCSCPNCPPQCSGFAIVPVYYLAAFYDNPKYVLGTSTQLCFDSYPCTFAFHNCEASEPDPPGVPCTTDWQAVIPSNAVGCQQGSRC